MREGTQAVCLCLVLVCTRQVNGHLSVELLLPRVLALSLVEGDMQHTLATIHALETRVVRGTFTAVRVPRYNAN